MSRAVVAVVGRPNVGKSTLFNRIVGERVAIVEALPGTTRDRVYATADWRGREFSLIDTGGLDDPKAGAMEAAVRRQAEAAIDEADVVMFVVDAQSGILPVEHDVADQLRRSGKPVLLVANKADSWRGEAQAAEFYELGLGEVYPVSAIQGHGTGDLLDAVVERLPAPQADEASTDAHIAIVGRPNVGKSSFLNTLVGSERAVVSEIPGTTRDSLDTALEFRGRRLVLVDTAGIRRRGRIEQGIEGRNVEATLEDALAIVDERKKRVPTSELHKMLTEAIAAHPPSPHRGKEVRFRHVTQARGKAPTFVFFVDPPEGVHFTYARYLENKIRDRFGFPGTPIKLEFKVSFE